MSAASRASLLLAASLLTTASWGCTPAETKGAAPRKDIVRVGYMPFLSSAPLILARDRGYFREESIEVELLNLNANDGITALAAGDADVYANLLSVGMLNAVARGARIAIVADKGSDPGSGCFSQGLVVRAGLPGERDLSTAEGLRGLKAGIRPMTGAEYVVDRLLARRSLPRDAVRIVEVPTESMADALRTGMIDTRISSEPDVTRLRELGIAVPWLSFDQIVPGGQWSVIAYGPRLLDRERGLGVRFLRAYLRGVRELARGKTPDNVNTIAAATGEDPALLQRACWPGIRTDGGVSAAGVADFAAWAVERGYTAAPVDAHRLVDTSFLTEAVPR